MKERRIKLLTVTPEMLIDLFKNESPITLSFHGMPQDAHVVGVNVNTDYRMIELAIHSESFPIVEPSLMLERFTVTVSRYAPSSVLC